MQRSLYPTEELYETVAKSLLPFPGELAKRKNHAIVIKARGENLAAGVAGHNFFSAGKIVKAEGDE